MKTKQLYLIFGIVFLGITQFANAQTPDWKWVKWSDGTQTTVRSICADASGNLYGAGTFNTTTKFDTSVLNTTGTGGFVVKYKSDGTVNWSRKIKNPGFAAIDCKSIAIDVDGNIYVTGAYSGTIELDIKTLTGGGHYLAKYNNSGAIQWVVNVQGSNGLVANASGIYLAGGSVIQKFDAAGTVSWTISGVKSNQGYTNFFSVALNSSGNLIVAGDIDDKWTFGTTLITGGYQNIVLMEVSSTGSVTWTKTFGANANGADHAQHICVDSSDNIIMTGKVGGASTFDAVNLGSKAGYLVKLNATGVAQWGTLTTNTATIYGDGGLFVTTNKAMDVFVTGGFGNLDVTDGGTKVYVKAIKNGGNAYILKFNTTGVFQSALTNFENPTINNSRGMALASSTTGVYFGGVCAPSSEWGTLKTTGYGSVFARIENGTAPGAVKRIDSEATFYVFPNPSNGIFHLNLKNTNKCNLTLINNLGEVINKFEVYNQTVTLDLSNYPKGIYLLQLNTESGLTTKKIILE